MWLQWLQWLQGGRPPKGASRHIPEPPPPLGKTPAIKAGNKGERTNERAAKCLARRPGINNRRRTEAARQAGWQEQHEGGSLPTPVGLHEKRNVRPEMLSSWEGFRGAYVHMLALVGWWLVSSTANYRICIICRCNHIYGVVLTTYYMYIQRQQP